MRSLGAALGAVLLLVLAACAPTAPSGVPRFSPARFTDLPGWDADRVDEALTALRRSCARIAALDPARPLGPAAYGTAGAWQPACARLPAGADTAAARGFLESAFVPVALADGPSAEGLFTGYFEPLLQGSRARGGAFQTPLLARPADLVGVELGQFREAWRGERIAGRVVDGTLRPYDTRAEIEAGSLGARAAPLAWVDDPVDAFFLHIQGSGRVRLAEGGELRLGFAGQNGHAYVPIGRLLAERGEIPRDQVSMPSIRHWLATHPAEGRRLMHENPSYVFFRELKGEGPLGAQGVPLTPGRSLAVDPSFVAYGVPVWLDAEDPLSAQARVRRLMVAQDTGGAIRGPVRGDVFWGFGKEAADRAGLMKSRGGYWLLLPRDVQPPQAR